MNCHQVLHKKINIIEKESKKATVFPFALILLIIFGYINFKFEKKRTLT